MNMNMNDDTLLIDSDESDNTSEDNNDNISDINNNINNGNIIANIDEKITSYDLSESATPNPINYQSGYYRLRHQINKMKTKTQEKSDEIARLRKQNAIDIEARLKTWEDLKPTEKDIRFKSIVNALDDEIFASLAFKYGKNNGFLINKVWNLIKDNKINEINEKNVAELNEYSNVMRWITYKHSSILSNNKEKELRKFWKNSVIKTNSLGLFFIMSIHFIFLSILCQYYVNTR